MIDRRLKSVIENQFFKNKAIIITGPRQVGKTTLLHQIVDDRSEKALFLNCDEPATRELLQDVNLTDLHLLIGKNRLLIIDEAQKVENIGQSVKLIIDNIKDVQVIVTGSSALELNNKLDETLTGRKLEYRLYPIASAELVDTDGLLREKSTFEPRLIYGSYPDILNHPADAREYLTNLVESYLYKDLLSLNDVRRPELLNNIVKALAFQVGSEVSYNELAHTVQSDFKTVEKYVDLLEKCFVVFRLSSFSRNLRSELKKSRKIYFYDNGVRNAIIQNFSPMNLRQDVGALWENFFIAERIKRNQYAKYNAQSYFWRTSNQQEIDYIEQYDDKISAFELKWSDKRKVSFPKSFVEAYNVEDTNIITPQNYLKYLL